MRSKIKKSIYPILLVIVSLLLFFTNYKQTTFLIGWDNLLPEFNINLDIQRNLTGVWQDYRGLGLLDGQSHISNLVHSLFVFALTFILPQNSIRFFTNIFLHFLGGLGMYYLAKKYFPKFAAFTACLFYLFNIGTIQQFFAPFEGFSFQFAALPWLFLTALNFIEHKNKKNLFIFFIIALLSTPESFVPTTFITTSLSLLSLIFIDYFKNKNIKSFIKFFVIFIIANSFWLFPYIYSIPSNSNVILHSHINQFSSEEMYMYNKAHGDIANVLFLKGFMIDSIEYDTFKKSNVYFMDAWRNHTNSLPYQAISFVFVCFVILGTFSILKNRKRQFYPFLFVFFISAFFLLNNTPILEKINTFLRNSFPIFAESFRFPFTKFITPLAFSYSFLLIEGIYVLTGRKLILQRIFLSFVFLSIAYFSYPAFLGNFFSPLLKVKMPNDYKNVFSYFNNIDDTKRTALLPSHTFWPWHYRTWGQRGSGFLWFGLSQPILERAFDQWSNYDEQFFNEFSYAVNTNNYELLNLVLYKYDISYLLVDGYMQNILLKPSINYKSLQNFLDSNPFLLKQKEFGKLIVYKTNIPTSAVYKLDGTITRTSPDFSFKRQDPLIGQNYVFSPNFDASYVFSSLESVNSQDNLDFKITKNQNSITLIPKNKFINNTKNRLLEIPSLFEGEFLIPIQVIFNENKLILTPTLGTIKLNNESIEITEDPLILEPDIILKPEKIVFENTKQEFDIANSQNFGYLLNNQINTITLIDKFNRKETLTLDTSEIKRQPVLLGLPSELKIFQISLKKVKSNLSNFDVIKNKDYQILDSKNELNPYKNKASYARMTEFRNKLLFEAKSDSKELLFFNNNLFHQGSYLLLADTKHYSGIPISFYFDNHPQIGSDLEIRFPKKENLAAIVIQKTQDLGSGYAFHFTIKSMGTETAKAEIGSIELFPFAQKTLSHIRVVSTSSVQNQNPSVKTPIRFTKQNPFTYLVEDCCNSSYIVLSQAYDPGWRAYRIQNSESRIQNYINTVLPFVFGKELKEHVVANGWANGWLIGNWKLEIGNSQVILVYLPQYLEFFGFIFITITAFVIRPKNLKA